MLLQDIGEREVAGTNPFACLADDFGGVASVFSLLTSSVCLFFLDCSGLAEYRGVFPFPIISRQNTLPKLPKTVKSLSAF